MARYIEPNKLDEILGHKNGQYVLLSRSTGRVLQYFGKSKPSQATFDKAERRVKFFKYGGGK